MSRRYLLWLITAFCGTLFLYWLGCAPTTVDTGKKDDSSSDSDSDGDSDGDTDGDTDGDGDGDGDADTDTDADGDTDTDSDADCGECEENTGFPCPCPIACASADDVCGVLPVGDIGFCASPCTTDTDCVPPVDCDAMAQCTLIVGEDTDQEYCGYVCGDDGDCPTNMYCDDQLDPLKLCYPIQ